MKPTPILDLNDIKLLVETFYANVRADEMLGPIFNNAIGDRWPMHLEKMYRFWQTVLLDEHTYSGSPFPVHMTLDISKINFERWILIFSDTVDSLFIGEKAEEAKWRGERMAVTFHYKIEHHKSL